MLGHGARGPIVPDADRTSVPRTCWRLPRQQRRRRRERDRSVVRGRTSVSVIRSSQYQCTGQVGIRYRREVCSLAPESALWPSRKVSGPRLPRFASSPPNDALMFVKRSDEVSVQQF